MHGFTSKFIIYWIFKLFTAYVFQIENRSSTTVYPSRHRNLAIVKIRWTAGSRMGCDHYNMLLFVFFGTIFRTQFGFNVIRPHRTEGTFTILVFFFIPNCYNHFLALQKIYHYVVCLIQVSVCAILFENTFFHRYYEILEIQKSENMRQKFNRYETMAIFFFAVFYWAMC